MKIKVLKSYAKVNLFLKVGKKIKKNKLHNIQSLIFLLNIFDKIIFKKSKSFKDRVKFTGEFDKKIHIKNNSIIKSLSLLRKRSFINKNKFFDIIVKKNIPTFAGLGGGSSNAATVIKYFTKNKNISKEDINFFSKVLGSDLRLFLGKNNIFQKSLFKISEFKLNYKFYFVLVFPYLSSSTKLIYSKVKKFDIINNQKKIGKKSKNEFIQSLKSEKNSLENIVTHKYPVIRKVLRELELQKNCCFSRVTGSGSACFGLFLSKRDATLARNKIKRRFPKFWCILCTTI